MRSTRGRVVHVDSTDELRRRLAAGGRWLSGWRLHGLDLHEEVEGLLGCHVGGLTLLGCDLPDGAADRLAEAGALVLPRIPGVPIDPYRSTPYAATDLYDTDRYLDSFDARAYAWSQEPAGHDDLVAGVLHDQAVDTALRAWVRGRRVVGVMGGHALQRGGPAYADAAKLGHALARSATVATGGGPGAMEAANLGARFGPADRADLAHALAALATAPAYRPSIDAWVRPALEVLDEDPGGDSLGIPTWHYGHEPTNVFATAIAKYLDNAVREAVLLEVCDGGIVFLPGAAGTVQEVFQDACENYYADEASIAPMVLVGEEYWTRTLPAWPLLRALAGDRAMRDHVHLVTTVTEAVAVLQH